jgi:hypothetical protein
MYKIPSRFLTVGVVSDYCSTLHHVFLAFRTNGALTCHHILLIHRFHSLNVVATKTMTSDSEDGNGKPINKGACRKGQRRFTIQENAAIIRIFERLMQQHGMTLQSMC